MMEDDFEKLLESIGGRFPAKLDLVLKTAGYDSLFLISQINEDDIILIEEYASKHPTCLIGTDYCRTEDDITEEFELKLKPGHRKFLLKLATIADTILKSKSTQKNKFKNERNGTAGTHSQSYETSKPSSSTISIKAKRNLEKVLVNKVLRFCQLKSIYIMFDETCISKFKKINNKIKCSVICPICKSSLACVYTTYWNISNLQAHLKAHPKDQVDEKVSFQESNAAPIEIWLSSDEIKDEHDQ